MACEDGGIHALKDFFLQKYSIFIFKRTTFNFLLASCIDWRHAGVRPTIGVRWGKSPLSPEGGRGRGGGGSRNTLMDKMTIHKHSLVLQVLDLRFDVDKYIIMCLSCLL